MGIEALARVLNIDLEDIDARGLRTDFATATGRVLLGGSDEEREFNALVSRFAEALRGHPPDLRAAFRRFISSPDNYPRASVTHITLLRRSVIAQYEALATRYDGSDLEVRARAIVRSLATADLKTQELYTLRDIARFASSGNASKLGEGLLRIIATSAGLRPGFQTYLMGLQAEVQTADIATWREVLEPLGKISQRAGDEPRFQDIWATAFAGLTTTIVQAKSVQRFLAGPTSYEMLVRGLPSENDAGDARKRSILVLLNDGEHELVTSFLNYLFSRRAGRGILDGIIHVAAMRPLVQVSRELVTRAIKELDDLTNTRKDDFRSELMRTGERVWHLIRPLLDGTEAERISQARSADAYLKDFYKRNRGTTGNGSGGNSNGGATPQRKPSLPPRGRQTTLFYAQPAMTFAPLVQLFAPFLSPTPMMPMNPLQSFA